MTNTLILALDRTGCLQTARWSEANRGRLSPNGYRRAQKRPTLLRETIPEINNDAGWKEIPIYRRSVVCAGQSAPDDHPHVSLTIGKDGQTMCPYCGTRYRLRPVTPP
jgi:uncharacterized Zn-finger protein